MSNGRLTHVIVNLSVMSISSPPLVVRFLLIPVSAFSGGSMVSGRVAFGSSDPYKSVKLGRSMGRSAIGLSSGTPLLVSLVHLRNTTH